MILLIVNIVALLFLAGLCNGRMDYIKLHNLDKDSWMNKWFKSKTNHFTAEGEFVSFDVLKNSPLYYFGLYKPKYKEAFIYSSTVLVFLTDEWHRMKWLMFLCFELIVSYFVVEKYELSYWLIPVFVLCSKTFRGIGFALNYDKK